MKLITLKKKLTDVQGDNKALRDYTLHHIYARLETMMGNPLKIACSNSELEATFFEAMAKFGLATLIEGQPLQGSGAETMPKLQRYQITCSGSELHREFIESGYKPLT